MGRTRGNRYTAEGIRKQRYRRKKKTTSQASASAVSPVIMPTNIQPVEQEGAPELVPDQASALVEQFKAQMKQNEALMEQNQALVKRNDELVALLEESQRKADVMTNNWLKAKKSYISEKKAFTRKYEDLNLCVGSMKTELDETRMEVSELNGAMHFVLEKGHEGKYHNSFWSQTREWKKTK
ncbi:hypothetical protein B0T20DRAFT_496252 [Sordaria brevicollis]|uniref:Uncharacterized protein n=1 Tax=Sordaria brevicollis TaxID=83679 RepID=A0AAE0PHC8_SORBR|nr:hypothetical protein B0T20DRAFT_496252 [Sordaria brevicollis]